MSITRATTRLGCLRPLLSSTLGSVRRYSTGPLPKSPLSQKFQHLIKPFAQSFEKAVPSKIPRFLAAGIALTSSYWLFNAFENQPSNEACTATQISEDENDLSVDFEAQIEARRFIMVDTNGKEYDFGSYFHGYGKGLVKGMNLNFKRVTLDNGSKRMELSFKINELFHKRLRKKIDELDFLSDTEKKALALRLQAKDIYINREATYKLGLEPIVGKEGGNGSYRYIGSAYLVDLKGLGSLMIGKDTHENLKSRVKVTLNEGATIESFQKFLSIFDLQDALEKSSNEDVERLKVAILFRTFFPKRADDFEKCGVVGRYIYDSEGPHFIEANDSFFTLPVDLLKQKIIASTPAMKDVFAQHTVEKRELLPGYVRYGARIDKDVRELGARALTMALTSPKINISEYDPVSDEEIEKIANILKNGLISQEMREKIGMNEKGYNDKGHYKGGGATSVYTQMIKNSDFPAAFFLWGSKVDFGYRSSIHFYISLDALNHGSYQYTNCMRGRKGFGGHNNILDYTKETLRSDHEIMIPDIIRTEHIKAISVKTEKDKQRIILRLRQCNLLQRDLDSKESYNGIPVDEFIQVTDRITRELVKNCC